VAISTICARSSRNWFVPARERGAEPIGADRQERELLAQVVVQFAGDAVALRLLAGDQASGQIAAALVGAVPVRHVADDAEHAVLAGAHEPRFELPETAVQRELATVSLASG